MHLPRCWILALILGAPFTVPAQERTPLALHPELTCVLQVTDLERATRFYEQVLGARVVFSLPDVGFAELATPLRGVTIGLARSREPRAAGGAMPTFHVADAAAAEQTLRRHAVAGLGAIEEMPGLCKLLRFQDPDGNVLQLVQSLRHEAGKAAPATTAPAAPPAGDDPLAPVAFLIGTWRHTDGDYVHEEQWLPPLGGTTFGIGRMVRGGKLEFFEQLSVRVRNGVLCYIAQPGGRPGTVFELSEAKANAVTFANQQHDFPKRIRYWLEADGSLRARVDDGTDAGKHEDFAWRRVP